MKKWGKTQKRLFKVLKSLTFLKETQNFCFGQIETPILKVGVNHEIEPVESGYRCVLSNHIFDETKIEKEEEKVIIERKERQEIHEKLSNELPIALLSLFHQLKSMKYYFKLLDHSYSPSTLSFDYLKGKDLNLYRLLKDDFEIQIVPVSISNGFLDENIELEISFDFEGKNYVFTQD